MSEPNATHAIVAANRGGRDSIAANLSPHFSKHTVRPQAAGSGTASGQKLNREALTAAHRTLPFGSKVKVTNKRNGRSVVVTINDRGPFVRGRVIDVTPAAAQALGFSGLTQVTLNAE